MQDCAPRGGVFDPRGIRQMLVQARHTDYILHVVDGSDENAGEHMQVVYRTLADLAITGKPVMTVINKCDLPGFDGMLRDERADRIVSR